MPPFFNFSQTSVLSCFIALLWKGMNVKGMNVLLGVQYVTQWHLASSVAAAKWIYAGAVKAYGVM